MPTEDKMNWEALCLQFSTEKAAGKIKTAREFCDQNALSYFTFSRKFARSARQISPSIKRRIINEVKAELQSEYLSKAKAILSKASPDAAQTLVDGLDAERSMVVDKELISVTDPHAQSDNAIRILDRVGISPAVAQVNINQQNIQALVIPPLFASEEAQNLKTMMGE